MIVPHNLSELSITHRAACSHKQDTFAFALLLLCLASGDIDLVKWAVHSAAGGKSYLDGWRPSFRPPSIILSRLICAMWSDDYRQRPAMKDVVAQLEACVSLDDAGGGEGGVLAAALPAVSSANELTLHLATIRTLQFKNQQLNVKVAKFEAIEDSEHGILGGMYEFVPNRQGSILGQGVRAV